jgi:hypothetical protein
VINNLADKDRGAAGRFLRLLLTAALAGKHARLVVLRLVLDGAFQAAHLAHPLVDFAPRVARADAGIEHEFDVVQRRRAPTVQCPRQAERLGRGIGNGFQLGECRK